MLAKNKVGCISFDSYIKPQLPTIWMLRILCCISFDSYIKPQRIVWRIRLIAVVYLLIPTSNHNLPIYESLSLLLYIFWFLHQTTTCMMHVWKPLGCISFDSYIKPQLFEYVNVYGQGCISFDSYIKPQRFRYSFNFVLVVYLLIPTSNHNPICAVSPLATVVYLLIPTSNHNWKRKW